MSQGNYFITVLNTIIQALEEISEFKMADIWQGDVEDLLKNVQKLPSAHAILSTVDFDESRTLRADFAPAEMLWSVVIMSQNLRDRKSGALDSLTLIGLVLNKLTRLNTGSGYLWPVKLQLIAAENGKTAYGFHFRVKKEK